MQDDASQGFWTSRVAESSPAKEWSRVSLIPTQWPGLSRAFPLSGMPRPSFAWRGAADGRTLTVGRVSRGCLEIKPLSFTELPPSQNRERGLVCPSVVRVVLRFENPPPNSRALRRRTSPGVLLLRVRRVLPNVASKQFDNTSMYFRVGTGSDGRFHAFSFSLL